VIHGDADRAVPIGASGLRSALADLQATIVEGAAKRLRPKFMTVATMFVGLIPIMWATGAGSDVWKRIAAPMVGGIFTSFVLELVVYPAIYEIWKWHFEMKRARAEAQPAALSPCSHPRQRRECSRTSRITVGRTMPKLTVSEHDEEGMSRLPGGSLRLEFRRTSIVKLAEFLLNARRRQTAGRGPHRRQIAAVKSPCLPGPSVIRGMRLDPNPLPVTGRRAVCRPTSITHGAISIESA
jgi:hypothetical protein